MKAVIPRSNWTVSGLLSQLPPFRRVDGGGDELAFRLACDTPGRTAYVYLSPDEPAAIHFCLEDSDARDHDWCGSGECGCVGSAADLSLVLRWWLAVPVRAA
jgi:hypothetical protein